MSHQMYSVMAASNARETLHPPPCASTWPVARTRFLCFSHGVKTSVIGRVVGSALVSTALLVALGASAGAVTGVVPKSTVEANSAKVLAQETGQELPKVVCRSGLKAKIGASIHCTVTPHGSTTKYPATVTVRSLHNGVANFHIQVGQAIGAANKVEFCHDNALLLQATFVAQTPADLIPIFKANKSTILDFQATAPSSIVAAAGTLVQAARTAVNTGNANEFTTAAVQNAASQVNAFCGQNPDGSPVG